MQKIIEPVRCFLGLGSSLGYRENYLRFAMMRLALLPRTMILSVSRVYETEPVGGVAENVFLNAAIGVETIVSPADLLEELLQIEKDAGRDRKRRYEDRTLDIDILFYGDLILSADHLQIPHPRLTDRRFALVPLAEIAPDLKDPRDGRKIAELLQACRDQSRVELVTGLNLREHFSPMPGK